MSSVLEVQFLPQGTISQRAVLYALIRTLTLAQAKRVNVCIDSKYAFLTAHSHSAIKQERGFLTTKGTHITNASLSQQTSPGSFPPGTGGGIHCQGHQSSIDPGAQGNKGGPTARCLTTQMPMAPMLTNSPNYPWNSGPFGLTYFPGPLTGHLD